jgi:hypothetical protein
LYCIILVLQWTIIRIARPSLVEPEDLTCVYLSQGEGEGD